MQTIGVTAGNPATESHNILREPLVPFPVRRTAFLIQLTIPIVLIHACFMFTQVAHGGAYFDSFSDQIPPALPSNWISSVGWSTTNVASLLDTDRHVGGNVLCCITQDRWLTLPDFTPQGVVAVSFLSRYENPDGGMATVRVSRADDAFYADISVKAGAGWMNTTLWVTNWQTSGNILSLQVTATHLSCGILYFDNFFRGEAVVAGATVTADPAYGIPENWLSHRESGATHHAWSEVNIGGTQSDIFRANVGGAAGSVWLVEHNWLPPPPSGNLVVDLDVRNNSASPAHNDYLDVVATTNDNWAATSPGRAVLGANIFRYDSAYTNGHWRRIRRSQWIEGLQGCRTLRIGLRATATGFSGESLDIDNIVIRFPSLVEASTLGYSTDPHAMAWPGDLSYNATPYAAVTLTPRPAEDVLFQSNVLVSVRDPGQRCTTNRLRRVADDGNVWATENPLGPFESGETNRLRVISWYTSAAGLETESPVQYPAAPTWQAAVVGGLGSVWLNELSTNQVEVAAPAGRGIAGWKLRIDRHVGDVTNAWPDVGIAPDLVFGDNHNGIGFKVLAVTLPVSGSISLVNSAGVVEHHVVYDLTETPSGAVSLQGTAPWPADDYSAYSRGFDWAPAAQTFGAVNAGQRFERPVVLNTKLHAVQFGVSGSTTSAVPYALCSLVAQFSPGFVTNAAIADNLGWTLPFQARADHTSTFAVAAVASASAFGHGGTPVTSLLMLGAGVTNTLTLDLLPTVGWDTFPGITLAPCWLSTYLKGTMDWVNDGGFLSLNSGGRGASYETLLQVRNAVSPRGAACATLKFKLQNTSPPSVIDQARLLISSSPIWGAGTVGEFMAISNRYDTHAQNAWIDYEMTIPVPLSCSNSAYFHMLGHAAGYSGQNINIDDLRLSFHNTLVGGGLALLPPVPKAGTSAGCRVELIPWGACVSNVLPVMCYRVNGGPSWTERALCEPFTLTNSLSYAFTNALPPFATGDVVEYYLAIRYQIDEGCNAVDTGIRYIPDNATYDLEAHSLSLLHIYTNGIQTATVQGINEVWFNEVKALPDGMLAQHFIELAGVTNIGLSGWKIEVRDLVGGETTTYAIPADTQLITSPAGGYAFYTVGGVSVLPAPHQSLATALPRHGGLRLIDASNTVRYAVSYDAAGADVAADVVGYEYLGNGHGAVSFGAIERGNPVNVEFVWSGLVSATPCAINPNQSMKDPPSKGTILMFR